MKHSQPLVIGNWKMNPISLLDAKKIFSEIKRSQKKFSGTSVMIAPPAIYLPDLSRINKNTSIQLGVQNINPLPSGAHTGELSLPMVQEFGATFSIIGHSERRGNGETNDEVALKVVSLLKHRITPVVCIGESERDEAGNFFVFIEAQIKSVLSQVPKTRYKDIVFAYEPIWAIGTGKNATIDDIMEMQLFIQKVITKFASRTTANQIKILYGGSVHGGNAGLLFQSGALDGFLVGGASLKPTEFLAIVTATTI
jgi:triosephosphate isomerase (TIM)